MIDLKREKGFASLKVAYGGYSRPPVAFNEKDGPILMYITERNKTKQRYCVAWIDNTQEFLFHPYAHPENDVWADDISKLLPYIDAILK